MVDNKLNPSSKSSTKMGKTGKKNDIILRNILNIAKIKPRDKDKGDKRKSGGGNESVITASKGGNNNSINLKR